MFGERGPMGWISCTFSRTRGTCKNVGDGVKSTFHKYVPDMRGKKRYVYPCGCCTAIDLRGKYWASLAKKEMKEKPPRIDVCEAMYFQVGE